MAAGDVVTFPPAAAAVAPVIFGTLGPVNSVLPAISGTAQVGHTLTASTGTWTNAPVSFTRQWYRAGIAIASAINSTYVPVAADIGSALTVRVTASNNAGASVPAISLPTSAVIP